MSKMVINWIYGQYIYPNIIQDIYQKFYYISDYGTILDYEKIIKPQYFLMKEIWRNSDNVFYFINNRLYEKDKIRDWRSRKFFDFSKIKYENNSDTFNQAVGNDYEAYIGKKYEKLGYKVEYRGMIKGVFDGGIDLICKMDKKIIFVQCKNWAIHKYKINQKDLRAFVGDVQLLLMKDDTKYSNISYNFIISDKEILSNNAKKFLEEYTFIKWKVEKM